MFELRVDVWGKTTETYEEKQMTKYETWNSMFRNSPVWVDVANSLYYATEKLNYRA
jgi:hypothetical protein